MKNQKNNMEEIFKKTKKGLMVSIILFIILMASVVVLYVMINETAKNTILLKQELVDSSKEDIVTLKRAIRNYEKHKSVVEDLVINKNNAFAFIGDIEKIALDSGLVASVDLAELSDVLSSGAIVEVNSGGPKRSHGQLQMTMGVDGEWDEIISFLIKLENIPQQAIIDSVRLSTVYDQETKSTGWTASFNILAITN